MAMRLQNLGLFGHVLYRKLSFVHHQYATERQSQDRKCTR